MSVSSSWERSDRLPEGRVALLFSGGLDSASAAILLAREFREIHLFTYDNGHGHLFVKRSRGTAADLARAFPGRFTHHIARCGDLFHRLVTEDVLGNYRRYGSRFVWCLGCKMAMHSETIATCLCQGIGWASDGSSSETAYYVEQSPVGLRLVRGLYGEFGIRLTTPVHRLATRGEERRLLDAHGVRTGITFRDRNPGTQPLCLPGNGLYLLSTLLSVHPDFPIDQVEAFFADKAPICREWIARRAGGRHG